MNKKDQYVEDLVKHLKEVLGDLHMNLKPCRPWYEESQRLIEQYEEYKNDRKSN